MINLLYMGDIWFRILNQAIDLALSILIVQDPSSDFEFCTQACVLLQHGGVINRLYKIFLVWGREISFMPHAKRNDFVPSGR